MQISFESYRTRWLILVGAWALAAFVVFQQATLVRGYLDTIEQMGLRGASQAQTPLKEAYPAFAADAQTWVRHALSLLEGDQIQLRSTTIDNAPDGREVHWNSAWAWTIAGAGWLYHLFTGQPLPASVEKATIWLNPCIYIVLIAVLSAWATRRAGVIAGLVITAAMVGNDRIYEGFFPGYVDHHGLLTVAVFGMVLGAILMGGGWWRQGAGSTIPLPGSPQNARSAAVFSAICGACGLWVSAASVLAPIALVGFSGLATVLVQGRASQKQGAVFDPHTWRLWGRVGAAVSTGFYLLEYFPSHLGFRLEANHPFYALAWLGGGELIAQLGQLWLAPQGNKTVNWAQLMWPVVAICIAPLTIAIGGVKVFMVMDPFMARLHRDYIQEFLPIWRSVQGFDAKTVFQVLVVDNLPLILGIATLTYYRREAPVVLWFGTLAALLFNAMAWWQSRWLLNASGVQVCLSLVLIASWGVSFRPRGRWIIALAVVGLLYVPSAVVRSIDSASNVKARRVSPQDANGALSRDIAAVIRGSQPNGEITLLTSPNASTSVGYYGRFKTLGTLYWENLAGLKAAASIYAARSEEEAAALIRTHRVTHIALISQENFIQQYHQLLHPNATVEEIKQSFGYRLFVDKVVPQWLEMIPYKLPDDLAVLKVGVMLFKVNFQQNLAEAIYHVALAQITAGEIELADRALDILLQQAPHIYQPWLRKGELLMARHDWPAATEAFLKGISLAPINERPALYLTSAASLYNQRQHALAVSLYRAALAEQKIPEIAANLAWVLSTSPVDSLRNGKEALELAQGAIKADPSSTLYLNALAAAFAENGNFSDAIATQDRALATARIRGETSVPVFAQRLATLQSGKPVRN